MIEPHSRLDRVRNPGPSLPGRQQGRYLPGLPPGGSRGSSCSRLDVVDRSAVKVGDVVLTPAGPRTVAKSFKAVHLGDTWILHYADGAWSAARCLYPTMLLVR